MQRDSWYLSSCFYSFVCSWKIFLEIMAGAPRFFFFLFLDWRWVRQPKIDSLNNPPPKKNKQGISPRDLICTTTPACFQWYGVLSCIKVLHADSCFWWLLDRLDFCLPWFCVFDITIFNTSPRHISSCLDHTAPAGASSLSSPSSAAAVSHYWLHGRRG